MLPALPGTYVIPGTDFIWESMHGTSHRGAVSLLPSLHYLKPVTPLTCHFPGRNDSVGDLLPERPPWLSVLPVFNSPGTTMSPYQFPDSEKIV